MIENYLYNDITKNIIIPWSGGVDSTVIILKVMKYLENNEETFNKLDYVYIVSVKSTYKQGDSEERARNKIIKHLKKKHNKVFKKFYFIEFDKPFLGYNFVSGDLPQPYWWITTIFSHFGSNFTLLLGYHKGDDFWFNLDKFNDLINTSKKYFSNQGNRFIYYPLYNMYKDEIHEELPNKLKKMVSYCETPKDDFKPCNECYSCKTHNKFVKDKK